MMAFLFMINLYCMRVNLSIAIVTMVNQTYVRESSVVVVDNNTIQEEPCPTDDAASNDTVSAYKVGCWGERG